jgi:hypothetical protein
MAQPSWVTGSGSLGTIPEGKFYRTTLEAYDPDFPNDSSKVKYTKVSGVLPRGMQVGTNGTLEGTPTATLQGTPLSVSGNVTSKFSIRVFTEKEVNGSIVQDRLIDRTFTITVTGQDAPEFITLGGSLGNYFDGQLINTQIEFVDSDPSDTAIVSVVSGELPPGVTINKTGLIYGHIKPVTSINTSITGWENEAWDSHPLQFNTGSMSKNYQFTLRITDGIDYNLRSFSIYVGIATADSNSHTVDTNLMRTDTVTRAPFIDEYTEDLGVFLHDNFFIHQFKGVDYNSDNLNYVEGIVDTVDTTFKTADINTVTADYSTSLPAGLELDVDTGYLHGVLSHVGLTEKTHNFSVTVYKKDHPLVSNTFNFTMKVVGDINTNVKWNTNENLGSIDNGGISVLNVSATTTSNTLLQYRLKQGGVYNKLPQGLQLLSSGNIVGRVHYQMFNIIDYNDTADSNITVDTNLTTADTNGSSLISLDNNTTTLDSKFTFTVEAYSNDGYISTFKTFTVNVNKRHALPVHDLYIDALLPQTSRVLLDTLLKNQDIIKEELLYRSDDPFFGVTDNISYVHVYGLSPETLSTYAESLDLNHYPKQLTLGKIETAQALDTSGNIMYEVIYSKIIDNIHGLPQNVVSSVGVVEPNSLDNMRNRVIDKVGQPPNDLPTWMTSKQKNGTVLGFTPVWVIAYTLPGQSSLITYNINKTFSSQLNKIDFTIDRYTLGSQFTTNWDAEDQRWYPTDSTTFDIYNHAPSADSVSTNTDTDTITADLTNPSTVETIFDKRSCVFVGVRANKADISIKTTDTIDISADNGFKGITTSHNITDTYDKYLMFPKKDIINTI